jgi:hypothetical protein
MNNLAPKDENTIIPAAAKATENEILKSVIKESSKNVEKPLIRYFDLFEDSSPSYVLGYN